MYAGTEGGRGCTTPHRTLPLGSSFYYSLTDLYGQVAAIFNLAPCRLPGQGVYVRQSCSSLKTDPLVDCKDPSTSGSVFNLGYWFDFSVMSVQHGSVVYGLPACSYTDVLSGRKV